MKVLRTSMAIACFWASVGNVIQAQQVGPSTNAASIIPGQYFVAEQGPHHRLWQFISLSTNGFGGISSQTNGYTELETGMAHLIGGSWIPSSDEINLTANGAAATNAAHQAVFASDANTIGAIQLSTPDGKTLVSHVIGLSYADPATGSNAMIAQVTNSIGLLLLPNQVLYTNALSGDCEGDLLYVFTKAGLEQDLILRQQPPLPTEYGLSARGILLQLWTEFENAPTPDQEPSAVPLDNGEVLPDTQLGFGVMRIGPGRAFLFGEEDSQSVNVSKQWVTISNRNYLVEQISVDDVQAQLSSLPPAGSGNHGAMLRPGPGHGSWPPTRQARATASSGRMQIAKLDTRKKPGFMLDYSILSNQTNVLFSSDTTYYVSGSVVLYGSNVFLGGTVIKYTNGASIILEPTFSNPTATFLTGPYRPAVFTSKDDDSIGDVISGSSGTPSGYYANPALTYAGLTATVSNAFFKYCLSGVNLSGAIVDIRNAQFVNCKTAVLVAGGVVHLRNALCSGAVTNLILNTGAASVTAENVTFAGGNYLLTAPGTPASYSAALTNCLMANITNLSVGALTLTGAFNGFYATTNFGVSLITLGTYPFQSAAAGNYYLADQSVARNAGTTAIDSGLLTNLQSLTTYPPIVYSNVIFASDTTFWPQASRDTDAVDLGFHYWPLDYVCELVRVTNSTLQVMGGTAIGTGGASQGISLLWGGQFVSLGLPTNPNWVVRINLVQDFPDMSWKGKADSLIGDYVADSFTSSASIRFNNFSMPAQDTAAINNYSPIALSLTDCQFYGGKFSVFNPNLYLTNSLFDRVNALLDDSTLGNNVSPIVRNCLFHGGTLTINHWNGDTWIFSDNAFDQVTVSQSGDVQGKQNGYTTGTTRITATNANDIVTNITWYAGPLGLYYQATNSGFIDKGSTNANYVQLYQYTVTTNLVGGLEIKEGNTLVDFGFHYVAVDSNGNPIDTDGDGIPDYLEDANGNGKVDSGETDWQNATDLGLKVIITRPSANGAQ